MKINVLYFAIFRERLKRDSEELALPDNATVADAISALESRHDTVKNLAGRFQVALNQTMVDHSESLADGDEIALIPPVAGGSDAPYAVISEAPLSLDRVVAKVEGPDMGGIVTFVGAVRRTNQGHDVVRLEYEAYKEMAEKVMAELCVEIEGELAGVRLAVEHRVGTLTIGDAAVAIACAAPHRHEAFVGCRALIDRLKERVPIWKREVAPDGAEWIGLGP